MAKKKLNAPEFLRAGAGPFAMRSAHEAERSR